VFIFWRLESLFVFTGDHHLACEIVYISMQNGMYYRSGFEYNWDFRLNVLLFLHQEGFGRTGCLALLGALLLPKAANTAAAREEVGRQGPNTSSKRGSDWIDVR
jgi:hypothetical protein